MSDLPVKVLHQYWGYPVFRPLQEEIIQSVLNGNDSLALLPTGGGKSLCYQVPAMILDGICIVISPLIALMKDQVEALRSRGIKALTIFSGMSPREIDVTLDNAVYGEYKFLYVSPERLETEIFIERVKQMNVNLLAVDEAHCISQWGYDFRPAYLKIAAIREFLPKVPVLALTASATPRVQEDIKEKLAFRKAKSAQFIKSFDRPNLVYAVLDEEDKRGRLLKLIRKVSGTGLVYVRTRKTAREIAELLQREGISADYYHAGLEPTERSRRQEQWKQNEIRIMVCTNAFGMGIDKPDVRLVVHYELPENLEAYYQEAGRAGRDEKRAFAIALTNNHDRLELNRWAELNYPTLQEVLQVYHALGNYFQLHVGSGLTQSFDFILPDFCQNYSLNPLKTHSALKILEQTEYISLSESVFIPSRLIILMSPEDLYGFEVAHKKYEPLIKLILRSYGGCFEEYVSINEQLVAKRLHTSTRDVIQQLHDLQKMHAIDYQPVKTAPQLTFLTERLSRENIHIDSRFLSERKKIHEARLKAMMDYAFKTDGCRGKVLLSYFGEKADENCGHCDWCLRKAKAGTEEDTAEIIKTKVLQILSGRSFTLETLVKELNTGDEKAAVKTIRWMIDEKLLCWKEDKSLAIA